jgi:DNA-3-methyladenine glycosylase
MSTDRTPFDQDIVSLARWLVGARLQVRGVGGMIIETEAYGRNDPASHSFRGPRPRNAAMFGPPGSVYVYLSYGCHLCLNLVGREGEAVLIRTIRPEFGVDIMAARRGRNVLAADLCSGPGRVGQALGVRLDDNGKLVGETEFVLTEAAIARTLLVGPRIGIGKATDLPWRFGLAGYPGLSRPFPKPILPVDGL